MPTVDTGTSPLFTDKYELTMAACYVEHGVEGTATFSLFVRPSPRRPCFVAAGIEEVCDHLAGWHFTPSDLAYLADSCGFTRPFLDHLARLRFSGELIAMPEGTVCFADEPILEVTAPIVEAQLLETYLLNTIGFQTLITTKAARCRRAAGDRPLIDFSLRRTQGRDAGFKVARSTYLAGFQATSNVAAGQRYGIPISGTMAHSFVAAFENEIEAFRAYARTFPHDSVFLIDTYDTLQGADHAIAVAREMAARGQRLRGVRLDSGDMVALSREVRRRLDAAGFEDAQIVASSGFDEALIAEVLAAGACIDAFGVGTKVGVSSDAPYLDVVYKLTQYEGRPIHKLSPGKAYLPGPKQVWRQRDAGGVPLGDLITQRRERVHGATPLLVPFWEAGTRRRPAEPLAAIRRRLERETIELAAAAESRSPSRPYPVNLSDRLARSGPAAAPGG